MRLPGCGLIQPNCCPFRRKGCTPTDVSLFLWGGGKSGWRNKKRRRPSAHTENSWGSNLLIPTLGRHTAEPLERHFVVPALPPPSVVALASTSRLMCTVGSLVASQFSFPLVCTLYADEASSIFFLMLETSGSCACKTTGTEGKD